MLLRSIWQPYSSISRSFSRAEEDHPVLLSHVAKYRSLMPALALIVHLIDGVDAGTHGALESNSATSRTARRMVLELSDRDPAPAQSADAGDAGR